MKCECNYPLGMGPNLLCPIHGKREDLDRHAKALQAENERLREALCDECAAHPKYCENPTMGCPLKQALKGE